MRRFLAVFLAFLFSLLTFHLTLLTPAYAEGEFASSYQAHYTIDESGLTTVDEQISLKNLTDRFYASSFNLTIGATQITDLVASDKSGDLEASATQAGNKSTITVKFASQLAGKDKVYSWNLKFKTKDFAQKQGKIWQVSIPRISDKKDIENYSLQLSVPVEFGDPASIVPEPTSATENSGQINFNFSKDQLIQKGVLANFGTTQTLQFKVSYIARNQGILPIIAQIPLPPDTSYQKVLIQNITPKPDNVIIDQDGNYIALLKLSQRQDLTVTIDGLAQLFLPPPLQGSQLLSQAQFASYTASSKYWQKDNPLIKNKSSEILTDQKNSSVTKKAQQIDQFVINTLTYDEAKAAAGENNRLGAVTALANPDNATAGEFSDLFVALSRAAAIPAREVIGYAYSANNQIRPLSYKKDVLHAWVEYFDPERGWVMIDPTWENTTGGVDYFSKFDLNHFALAIRGVSSQTPIAADQISANFSEAQFQPVEKVSSKLTVPSEILAGLPTKAKISIENLGNTAYKSTPVKLSSRQVIINGFSSIDTPNLPPFGHVEYPFSLQTNLFSPSFTDSLVFDSGDERQIYQIQVKPFFKFSFFPILILLLVGSIFGIYLAILGLHLNNNQLPVKIKLRLPKIKKRHKK